MKFLDTLLHMSKRRLTIKLVKIPRLTKVILENSSEVILIWLTIFAKILKECMAYFREAGLQCVLVEGVCKKFEHEAGQLVGDESDDMWTAVHVQNGGWQLVHPYWICRGKSHHLDRVNDHISRPLFMLQVKVPQLMDI